MSYLGYEVDHLADVSLQQKQRIQQILSPHFVILLSPKPHPWNGRRRFSWRRRQVAFVNMHFMLGRLEP